MAADAGGRLAEEDGEKALHSPNREIVFVERDEEEARDEHRHDEGHAMKIQKNLRPIILIELLLPLALLVFGVYHGVMQVLYRSGIIISAKTLGIDYYQGLTAHGVINAIVLTTFFAVALGNVISSQYLGECVSSAGEWAALMASKFSMLTVQLAPAA